MIEYTIQKFKKYFIPHPGNDNRPHILRPRTVAFIFIVMLVAESAFVFSSTYVMPRSKLFGLIEATALVNETNQQRTANGDSALQVSSLLQQAAQDKANDMAANSYFAHTSPAGITPWDWFTKVGYSFSYAGENLAVDFSNSQDVTNAWMNSPEHRANILNGDFTQIGMATAQGALDGQPAIFVVEEFGTPAATAPLAFVNTAAAATVTNPAPVIAPTATPAPKPAPSKPVTTTTSKPKPNPVVVAPIVVASASVENSSSQQLFVAVKGAETQTVPVGTGTATPATATATVSAVAAPATTQTSNRFESGFQWLVSDPRAYTDDFYIFMLLLFVVASILNFFIKIRVQFPRLILGGMTIIVLAGLCMILNQNVGLLHSAII
jgi:NADH:ubiquinone oxidoreductase subunit 3 (subunit A)